MAKSLLKQRAKATQENLVKLGHLRFGVVFRNTPEGGSATVQCGDWKLAVAGSYGYEKESTAIAKFLSPVIPGLPYGTGMRNLTEILTERCWTLKCTYSGWKENGYEITRRW